MKLKDIMKEGDFDDLGLRNYGKELDQDDTGAGFKNDSMFNQLGKILDSSGNPNPIKHVMTDDGQKIEVIELDKFRSKSTTLVKQLIYGDRKIPYTVIFALKKDDFDYWKIGNFKFENIDFGRIYKKLLLVF